MSAPARPVSLSQLALLFPGLSSFGVWVGKEQFPGQRLLPGTWALERKEQAGWHPLSPHSLPPVAQLHLPTLGCRWQTTSVILPGPVDTHSLSSLGSGVPQTRSG